MAKYKELRDDDDGVLVGYCVTDSPNGTIPLADGNRHYEDVKAFLADGNTPDPADVHEETWLDKRRKNMADGGYGTVTEQLEMIGELGIDAFQTHIAAVKVRHPKSV